MKLELSILDPTPSQQQLTFSCVNECEPFRIRLTACAAVDTIGIDTSAGDVTTRAQVDYIDFAITDAYELRVGSMTIKSDSGITSSPNVDKAEKERCEALAKYLFRSELTFTTFAHGEQQ
jgi:hypothetical protein